MSKAQITERQQYWRDHVLAAAKHDGSIVEYAAANNLKTKDLYQWKTSLTKRGFLPMQDPESTPQFTEVKLTSVAASTTLFDDLFFSSLNLLFHFGFFRIHFYHSR